MKKRLLLILLLIIFIPFYVNAKTCDVDKISIESITIEEKSDDVVEKEEASVNGKDINLNLSMASIGDSIKYKIVIKNDSSENYNIDNNKFKINSNYIDYSISSNDNNYIVNANSTKTIYLKLQYSKEVPDEMFESGTYIDNKSLTVDLSTKDSIIIINPPTGFQLYFLIITVILLFSLTIFVLFNKRKYAKYMILLVSTSIIIPISIYALCKDTLEVKSIVTIEKAEDIPQPVYYYGRPDYVKKGDNVSKIINLSNNLEESLDLYDSYGLKPIVFGFKVENEIITEITIEYRQNNKHYSIIAADPNAFENNKRILADSFGENSCSLNGYGGYYCYNGPDDIGYTISTNGEAGIEFRLYACIYNNSGTICFVDL